MKHRTFILLMTLSVLPLLAGCGIRPGRLQPPSGKAAPHYPAVYPNPKTVNTGPTTGPAADADASARTPPDPGSFGDIGNSATGAP